MQGVAGKEDYGVGFRFDRGRHAAFPSCSAVKQESAALEPSWLTVQVVGEGQPPRVVEAAVVVPMGPEHGTIVVSQCVARDLRIDRDIDTEPLQDARQHCLKAATEFRGEGAINGPESEKVAGVDICLPSDLSEIILVIENRGEDSIRLGSKQKVTPLIEERREPMAC